MRYRVNWYYTRGILTVLLLTLSLFALFAIQIPEITAQQVKSQAPVLFSDRDTIWGIHQQLEINLLPQRIYSSAMQSTQSIRMNLDLQCRLEQISSLTAITLGPLVYNLYKLIHASQEWAEGGNREIIKMTVTKTPGISLRGLTRATNVAMGSVQYWVRILEQEHELESISLGRSKHFFDIEQQWTDEARLLYSLTQNKRISTILHCLNDNPCITTQKDLCTNLDIHKALLSYYIKILKTHNILEYNLRELSISTSFKEFLT